jgi:CheY-like chemotaxis protein
MRRALANLFQSVGLRVEVFGSAPELLRSKPPDVASCLVLDIRLPGLSGLDFQLELAKASIHIPIVFMTGDGAACVKTLRGINAPRILRLVVARRAKKRKNSSSARHSDQIRFRFRTAWAISRRRNGHEGWSGRFLE